MLNLDELERKVVCANISGGEESGEAMDVLAAAPRLLELARAGRRLASAARLYSNWRRRAIAEPESPADILNDEAETGRLSDELVSALVAWKEALGE